MAGYTSRNFLSLTIPSILGFLSILWFLKKRNSSSKRISKAFPVEDSVQVYPDKYHTLYPMKVKSEEADSGEETVCAELELKGAQSMPDNQSRVSNGVISQNPKVNGKTENMTRLCENGNTCLADEPISNGCRNDSVPLRNGDNNFELTNGEALSLNGADATNDESYAHAVKKTHTEMNCVGITNGVVKNLQNGFKSESLVDKVENSTASKSDIENEISGHPEEIKFKTAKNHSDVHKQHLPVCNGVTNGESTCSISHPSFTEAKLTSDKLLTLPAGYMVASSNELSSTSPVESYVTDIDEPLIQLTNGELVDTSKHLTQSADCAVANTDEHLSQSFVCESDDTNIPSSSNSCVIDAVGHFSSPIGDVVTDAENAISPINVMTDAENAIPPINVITDSENLILPINVLTDTGHLSPPLDYVVADSTELYAAADTQGEMLESPGAQYCDSLGSNDSGRGSEILNTLEADGHHQVYMVYEFEILPEDCGRLIGKSGRHVKFVNKQTNANIVIKKHPCFPDKKLCSVTGTETEINAALKLIRKRFPVEHFPSVTLAQINSIPISTLLCPETLKLSLPEGGIFEALLCSTVNVGHFFLQQPTHPTFHQLPPLTNAMTASYAHNEAPLLEDPTKGNVCAAEVAGGWYRAEVEEVFEETCRLKYLDYGGYSDVPKTSIRKIKCNYMLIPFQATECYLAGVMPLDDNGWSREATVAFEQITQGQLIQGCIVGYAENRVPYVNLYKITGVTSIFINQELVNTGLVRGIPLPQ